MRSCFQRSQRGDLPARPLSGEAHKALLVILVNIVLRGSRLSGTHATVPKSVPTPAVTAIASAPQNVTRIAPPVTGAPPACAARPPRNARNSSEVPETT